MHYIRKSSALCMYVFNCEVPSHCVTVDVYFLWMNKEMVEEILTHQLTALHTVYPRCQRVLVSLLFSLFAVGGQSCVGRWHLLLCSWDCLRRRRSNVGRSLVVSQRKRRSHFLLTCCFKTLCQLTTPLQCPAGASVFWGGTSGSDLLMSLPAQGVWASFSFLASHSANNKQMWSGLPALPFAFWLGLEAVICIPFFLSLRSWTDSLCCLALCRCFKYILCFFPGKYLLESQSLFLLGKLTIWVL